MYAPTTTPLQGTPAASTALAVVEDVSSYSPVMSKNNALWLPEGLVNDNFKAKFFVPILPLSNDDYKEIDDRLAHPFDEGFNLNDFFQWLLQNPLIPLTGVQFVGSAIPISNAYLLQLAHSLPGCIKDEINQRDRDWDDLDVRVQIPVCDMSIIDQIDYGLHKFKHIKKKPLPNKLGCVYEVKDSKEDKKLDLIIYFGERERHVFTSDSVGVEILPFLHNGGAEVYCSGSSLADWFLQMLYKKLSIEHQPDIAYFPRVLYKITKGALPLQGDLVKVCFDVFQDNGDDWSKKVMLLQNSRIIHLSKGDMWSLAFFLNAYDQLTTLGADENLLSNLYRTIIIDGKEGWASDVLKVLKEEPKEADAILAAFKLQLLCAYFQGSVELMDGSTIHYELSPGVFLLLQVDLERDVEMLSDHPIIRTILLNIPMRDFSVSFNSEAFQKLIDRPGTAHLALLFYKHNKLKDDKFFYQTLFRALQEAPNDNRKRELLQEVPFKSIQEKLGTQLESLTSNKFYQTIIVKLIETNEIEHLERAKALFKFLPKEKLLNIEVFLIKTYANINPRLSYERWKKTTFSNLTLAVHLLEIQVKLSSGDIWVLAVELQRILSNGRRLTDTLTEFIRHLYEVDYFKADEQLSSCPAELRKEAFMKECMVVSQENLWRLAEKMTQFPIEEPTIQLLRSLHQRDSQRTEELIRGNEDFEVIYHEVKIESLLEKERWAQSAQLFMKLDASLLRNGCVSMFHISLTELLKQYKNRSSTMGPMIDQLFSKFSGVIETEHYLGKAEALFQRGEMEAAGEFLLQWKDVIPRVKYPFVNALVNDLMQSNLEMAYAIWGHFPTEIILSQFIECLCQKEDEKKVIDLLMSVKAEERDWLEAVESYIEKGNYVAASIVFRKSDNQDKEVHRKLFRQLLPVDLELAEIHLNKSPKDDKWENDYHDLMDRKIDKIRPQNERFVKSLRTANRWLDKVQQLLDRKQIKEAMELFYEARTVITSHLAKERRQEICDQFIASCTKEHVKLLLTLALYFRKDLLDRIENFDLIVAHHPDFDKVFGLVTLFKAEPQRALDIWTKILRLCAKEEHLLEWLQVDNFKDRTEKAEEAVKHLKKTLLWKLMNSEVTDDARVRFLMWWIKHVRDIIKEPSEKNQRLLVLTTALLKAFPHLFQIKDHLVCQKHLIETCYVMEEDLVIFRLAHRSLSDFNKNVGSLKDHVVVDETVRWRFRTITTREIFSARLGLGLTLGCLISHFICKYYGFYARAYRDLFGNDDCNCG